MKTFLFLLILCCPVPLIAQQTKNSEKPAKTATLPSYTPPIKATKGKSATILSTEAPTSTTSVTIESAVPPTPTSQINKSAATLIPPTIHVTGTPDEKREKSAAALLEYDAFVATGQARISEIANGPAGSTGRRAEVASIVESFIVKGNSYLRNYAGFIKFSKELQLKRQLEEYHAMLKKLREG